MHPDAARTDGAVVPTLAHPEPPEPLEPARERKVVDFGDIGDVRTCPGPSFARPGGIQLLATPWVPGHYAVRGRVDGEPFDCEFDFPGPLAGVLAACEPGDVARLSAAGSPDQPIGIALRGSPAVVELDVFRNGDRLAGGTFRPEDRTLYPDGPECPPVLDSAGIKLVVPTAQFRDEYPETFCPATCDRGLDVWLRAKAWPAGHYGVEGKADGAAFRCAWELPPRPGTSAGCTGDDPRLEEIGARTGPVLRFLGRTPGRLELTLHRDGVALDPGPLRPDYRATWPNPDRCERPCRRGGTTLWFDLR
jgi:hypothetical protein